MVEDVLHDLVYFLWFKVNKTQEKIAFFKQWIK